MARLALRLKDRSDVLRECHLLRSIGRCCTARYHQSCQCRKRQPPTLHYGLLSSHHWSDFTDPTFAISPTTILHGTWANLGGKSSVLFIQTAGLMANRPTT